MNVNATSRSPKPETPPPWLSIVVPAYNERLRLGATLEHLRAYARACGDRVEVLVVDDGSLDGTAELAAHFDAAPLALSVLRSDRNLGKGAAVRRGMLAARGGLRLMFDADASAQMDQLDRLLAALERGADIAIGSRDLPGSVLEPPQPLLRRMAAWALRGVRRRLLLPELRDTQCGFKLFRAAAAESVFALQRETGWLFDCEVLALAARLGLRVDEVAIRWRHRAGSRVKTVPAALTALATLLRIRRRVAAVAPPVAGRG
ncbi:MAG: glycosyltransferase family 2 protein [Phycisphaerae bacterium]|jgi:dolichyl-phosphate beta-glucosyltransferase|nr:glycosyltransferase family 2 protein [Phycisphaerae bacterium]MCZ2400612.1 glycosyltransferase family 2 protein [Phycisphaerae bacterium]